MSDNSRQEECRDLDRCILKMEINIKDNSEMIIHGVRVECLWEMEILKMGYGKEDNTEDNLDFIWNYL